MKNITLLFRSFLFLIFIAITSPSQADTANTCWQSTKILGGSTFIIHGVLVAYKKFVNGHDALFPLNSAANINEFLYETVGKITVGGMTVKSGIDGLNTSKVKMGYTLFKLWAKIASCFSHK